MSKDDAKTSSTSILYIKVPRFGIENANKIVKTRVESIEAKILSIEIDSALVPLKKSSQTGSLIISSSASYDEESDNISFSQRLQMMGSSEDDASDLSQQIEKRYSSREDGIFYSATVNDSKPTARLFGKDCSTALHVCIQNNATRAAIELIRFGAPVNFPNINGLTPIIIASKRRY